jgi:eukaryotic-like serine/threonine-protein kinase
MKLGSAHFMPESDKRLGNKYLLLERLGDGSHGWVWRAERLADGEIVAVKIPNELSRDDRSLAEGRELLGIDGHPNLIRIFDMGRVPPEREWYAIEMEYFPSESLAQKLEQRSHHFGLTFERLFGVYRQVLEAVEYLASLHPPVSHGDLKPHNILVGQGDLVKLTDFGSSALPEEIYLRTRENGGTVLYAAPEFSDCTSRKGDFDDLLRGDIYSLGVLLYQLTTGRLPHDTQAQVRRHAPFPKPREITQAIAPALEQVMLRCLRRLPAERYGTLPALRQEFDAAVVAQRAFVPAAPPRAQNGAGADWSSAVLSAFERGDYDAAARLAAAEHARSGDSDALLMQLNALFRDRRWQRFVAVLDQQDAIAMEPGANGAAVRLLAIKAALRLAQYERAEQLLALAATLDAPTLEHGLCEASLAGLQADYPRARTLLEALHRRQPGTPEVLLRLIQVCEQQRDYGAAAGYLRAALRRLPEDPALNARRDRYRALGAW